MTKLKQVNAEFLVSQTHKLPDDYDASKLVIKELSEDFDDLMTALGFEFQYDELLIVSEYDEKTREIAFAKLA